MERATELKIGRASVLARPQTPVPGRLGNVWDVFFPGTTKPVGDPRMGRTVDDLKLARERC